MPMGSLDSTTASSSADSTPSSLLSTYTSPFAFARTIWDPQARVFRQQ
jgi:hypothetical protein